MQLITAISHDSQGTVTWQGEDGQRYISGNSNANTPLLFEPGYQNAGSLLHKTGSYYLQQTCEKSCGCTDSNHSQLLQEAELHTSFSGASLSKAASAAASFASKAAKGAVKRAAAAYHGVKAGYEQAKKHYNENLEADTHLEEAKKHYAKAVAALDKINESKLTDVQKTKLEAVKKALKDIQETMKELHTLLLQKTENPQPENTEENTKEPESGKE